MLCYIKDSDSAAVQEAEIIIKDFITNSGRNDNDDDGFHIHGWKWHTMSLIHEARRLSHIAATLHDRNLKQNQKRVDEISETESNVLGLKTVADYTIDFNMKGLHRIENEVFFPFLRQRISSYSFAKISENDKKVVIAAITTVLDHLDKDRKGVEMMGTSLVRRSDQSVDDCLLFCSF